MGACSCQPAIWLPKMGVMAAFSLDCWGAGSSCQLGLCRLAMWRNKRHAPTNQRFSIAEIFASATASSSGAAACRFLA